MRKLLIALAVLVTLALIAALAISMGIKHG